MTEPKRARDLVVGDVLADGTTILRIAPGARGLNMIGRTPEGQRKRLRYAPDTIMPGPGEHPSSFVGGHPWDRKRTAEQRKRQF